MHRTSKSFPARWALAHRLSGTRALCTGAYQTAADERPPRSDFEIAPRLSRHGARRHRHAGADSRQLAILLLTSTPPWATAVSRAYNRARSRILKAYPNKFIGIAAAPLQDIPRSDCRSGIRRQGIGSAFDDHLPKHQRQRFGRRVLTISTSCLGFPFEVFTAISALIFSGLLERFPTLKFGFFEVGIAGILAHRPPGKPTTPVPRTVRRRHCGRFL